MVLYIQNETTKRLCSDEHKFHIPRLNHFAGRAERMSNTTGVQLGTARPSREEGSLQQVHLLVLLTGRADPGGQLLEVCGVAGGTNLRRLPLCGSGPLSAMQACCRQCITYEGWDIP